jgi:hypothetical protein
MRLLLFETHRDARLRHQAGSVCVQVFGLESGVGLLALSFIIGQASFPIAGASMTIAWRAAGEVLRAGFDDPNEPVGGGASWFWHLDDPREQGAFLFCLVLVRALFRLQVSGALLQRGLFLAL